MMRGVQSMTVLERWAALSCFLKEKRGQYKSQRVVKTCEEASIYYKIEIDNVTHKVYENKVSDKKQNVKI